MTDELLFRVEGSQATLAAPITLQEAGLREREHLQEWVIGNPQMIGDDVKVVTFEFGRWVSNSGNTGDRLDVLGLDAEGTLVVIELKRDRATDTVDMQAIKYAAMASRFTLEDLAAAHAKYLGDGNSTSDALEALQRFAPNLSAETLRTPRIVLMAREFPPSVTATAVWLAEMGLDIRMVTFQAYRSGSQTLVSVSSLYPLRDVEDFMITPRQAEVRKIQTEHVQVKAKATVARLVDAGAIEDGATFRLVSRGAALQLRPQVDEWLEQHPQQGLATWRNDRSAPLIWAETPQAAGFTPTGLLRQVYESATGATVGQIQGTLWWVDDQDRSLVELADGLPGTGVAGALEQTSSEPIQSTGPNDAVGPADDT